MSNKTNKAPIDEKNLEFNNNTPIFIKGKLLKLNIKTTNQPPELKKMMYNHIDELIND